MRRRRRRQSAGADADIVVTETTKNQGTGASLPSATGFYLSTNSTLDAADVRLGSRLVPVLGNRQRRCAVDDVACSRRRQLQGLDDVLAKADWENAVGESVETNNARATGAIKIGPDLIVSVLTVPASAAAGSTINVSDTTKNQGGGSADPSTTRFYLSTNTTLDSSDVVLGNRSVPSVAAGTSNVASTALTLPTETAAGTYNIIALTDIGNAVPGNNRDAITGRRAPR